MIQLKSLECINCKSTFDLGAHLPLTIQVCGHTVCQACFEKFSPRPWRCPIDNILLHQLTKASFPTNFSLTGFLEDSVKSETCRAHIDHKIPLSTLIEELKACAGCHTYVTTFIIKSESPECPICFEVYNLDDRSPLIISQCGHTVCQRCLKTLAQCPFDNKKFSSNVNEFPVNLSVWELIEEKKNIKTPYGTDSEKVCASCILKNHENSHKTKWKVQTKKAYKNVKKFDRKLIFGLAFIGFLLTLIVLNPSIFSKAQPIISFVLRSLGKVLSFLLLIVKEVTVWLALNFSKVASLAIEWFISTGFELIGTTTLQTLVFLKEIISFAGLNLWKLSELVVEWIIIPGLEALITLFFSLLWLLKEVLIWVTLFLWEFGCVLAKSIILPMLNI